MPPLRRRLAEYIRNWKTPAQPYLDKLKVAEVARKDINTVFAAMRTKRATANRAFAVLSVMFSFATSPPRLKSDVATKSPKSN